MITIKSNLNPLSVNHIKDPSYRRIGGKIIPYMYLKKSVEKYIADYSVMARSQYRGELLSGRLSVRATITFGTKHRRDIQNCLKVELDALQGVVYVDDSQIEHLEIFKLYDKNKPSLVLEIREYELQKT